MYVRWKKTPVRKNGDRTMYAQCVESYREAGKPRQRVLLHLGSIRELELEFRTALGRFWNTVARPIRTLYIDEQREVYEALRKVVPRIPRPPSDAQRARNA